MPGPRPELSEDEDDIRENQGVALLASSLIHEGLLPKRKNRKKKKLKRHEQPEFQRRWNNAKDRFVEEAEDEMFESEILGDGDKHYINIEPDQISYADTPAVCDELASTLVDAFRESGSEFLIIGIDTEGDYDTLQMYTRIGGKTFAFFFQLSLAAPGNLLPPMLFELLNLRNVVFAGKNVEKEMLDLFLRYGFDTDRLDNVLVIDVLTLVRVCDVFGRQQFEDAVDFVENGCFRINADVVEGAVADALVDAGIRAVSNYFLDGIVDKRVRHVHKNRVDWSLKRNLATTGNRITSEMLSYGVTDAMVPFDCVRKAAEWLNVAMHDFAKFARRNPKLDPDNPFFNERLLSIARDLSSKGLFTRELKEIHRQLRKNHDRKMVEQTVRRVTRHGIYAAKRDEWRKVNDYPPVNDDPFRDGLLRSFSARPSSLTLTPTVFRVPAGMESATSIEDGEYSSMTVVRTVSQDGLVTVSVAPSSSIDLTRSSLPPSVSSSIPDSPSLERLASSASVARLRSTCDLVEQPACSSQPAVEHSSSEQRPSVVCPPDLSSSASRGSLRDVSSSQTSSSPVRPPSVVPVLEGSGRSSSKGEATLRKHWSRDISFFNAAPLFRVLKATDRIVGDSSSDEEAIDHLVYILREINASTSRSVAISLVERLPLRLLHAFTARLCHATVVHRSFLHTLTVVGYKGFGGAPIVDQLIQPRDASPFLFDYLITITPKRAQEFVDLSLLLVGKSENEIRGELRKLDIFPFDYLESVDVGVRFSPSRIADLVVDVCQTKHLSLPLPFKKIRVEEFFDYLRGQFTQGNVATLDFLSMVEETLQSYDLELDIAVEYYKNTIPDVAAYFASLGNLPIPHLPRAREAVAFVNPECISDHGKFASLVEGVQQCVISSATGLEKLRADLDSSSVVVVMPHEKPRLLPGAERIDMLSVRTDGYTFHLLFAAVPEVALAAVRLLKEYSVAAVVYSHCPQGLQKFLSQKYSLSFEIYDIRPEVDEKVGKPNTSFGDLARHLCSATLCRRGRVFSAQIKPSRTALWHREIQISLIHAFIARYRPTQRQSSVERMVEYDVEDTAEEERRREEEEGECAFGASSAG